MFSRVVEVITFGEKIDHCSFFLFHHFVTRHKNTVPLPKDEGLDEYKEETQQVLHEDCKEEGYNNC